MRSCRNAGKRLGAGYEAELALSGTLKVCRCAAVPMVSMRCSSNEEIKTYRGPLEGVPLTTAPCIGRRPRSTAICCARREGWSASRWRWFIFRSAASRRRCWSKTQRAACSSFEAQCRRYLDWARSEAVHRQQRNKALAALQFPMPVFRTGQRQLAVAVYHGGRLASGSCLMAEAPTGIGKTLGTLFPMLKAMAAEVQAGTAQDHEK